MQIAYETPHTLIMLLNITHTPTPLMTISSSIRMPGIWSSLSSTYVALRCPLKTNRFNYNCIIVTRDLRLIDFNYHRPGVTFPLLFHHLSICRVKGFAIHQLQFHHFRRWNRLPVNRNWIEQTVTFWTFRLNSRRVENAIVTSDGQRCQRFNLRIQEEHGVTTPWHVIRTAHFRRIIARDPSDCPPLRFSADSVGVDFNVDTIFR